MPETRQAPRFSLRESVQHLEVLKEEIGFSGAERETLAQALGHKSLSGPASSKLGALNHFGLIEKRDDSRYQISSLGKTVLLPLNEQEHARALRKAACTPSFFAELLEHFEAQRLPGMLPNILVRQFHVHESAGARVADVFRDSMQYAGLLVDGVLGDHDGGDGNDKPEELSGSTDSETKDTVEARQLGIPHTTGKTLPETQQYTVALNGAGRLAILQLPLPVKPADLERVRGWLNYMMGVVGEEPVEADGS